MAVVPLPVTVLMRGGPGAVGVLGAVVRPVVPEILAVATTTAVPKAKGPAAIKVV